MIFSASIENLQEMLEFIQASTESVPFRKNERKQIDLAAEELLVNIILHAYGKNGGDIQIDVYPLPDNLGCRITIRDTGFEFNPLTHENPNTSLPPHKRESGGLGIFLVKQNIDKISYVRDTDENRIILTKWINGGIPAENN